MDKLVKDADGLFISQEQRLKSFKKWPFSNKSACSTEKMAEAGFYWAGTAEDPDSAACFLCGKILDGWESTDDPWNEHTKHAPQCPFVKLGKCEQDLTVEQFLDFFYLTIKNNESQKFAKMRIKLKTDTEQLRSKIH